MNHRADILKELQEVAPTLASYKTTVPLPAVPTAYFQQLEETTMEYIKEECGQWVSTSTIQAPEGYFEKLSDVVMANIKATEEHIQREKTTTIPIYYQTFARMAAAAVLVGILALTIFPNRELSTPISDCQDGIACLTQKEIYQYMGQNSHEFGLEQIQETVAPILKSTHTEMNIENVQQYVEEQQLYIQLDDASTDIF